MAGHSHWAGIKHKKGRQDKERAKLFSKLSREITVAAKLGSTDPESNPRLRSAIQLAKGSNMPKDNIDRAIKKSNVGLTENYTSLRYEGFGPYNVAFIIETLTDNKNRSASNIRKILQKNGGRLGENGSASHLFKNCGVIRVKKTSIKENDALDIALGAGAEDIQTDDNYHEIYCKKEDFYKVKTKLEKKIQDIIYSDIEWRPLNYINLKQNQIDEIANIVFELSEDDDVQKTFLNCKVKF